LSPLRDLAFDIGHQELTGYEGGCWTLARGIESAALLMCESETETNLITRSSGLVAPNKIDTQFLELTSTINPCPILSLFYYGGAGGKPEPP
jgi:hypothetical protein